MFLPPLEAMCARGQAPNVLLLTLPWRRDPPRRGIFHFIPDDHAVIDHLFPFRNFLRDLTAFLLAAPSHGGVMSYYRESEENERAVIAERGYHLITEQSHFPGGRLPDDFHLAIRPAHGKTPAHCACAKRADWPAQSIDPAVSHGLLLRALLPPRWGSRARGSSMTLPLPRRSNMPPRASCSVLTTFLYPNRLFADQTHLNQAGARVYTEALFQLLKDSPHALQ